MLRFIVDGLIIAVILFTLVFLYRTYGGQLIEQFFGVQPASILLGETPLIVAIADSPEEHQKGLSGVESLPENEGMLFIFPRPGDYGFWMKDTLIPLDIIWVSEEFKIVHIERNVRPETYPTIYRSPYPARFVIETNAFFVSTFGVEVGDTITIPADRLPEDLK